MPPPRPVKKLGDDKYQGRRLHSWFLLSCVLSGVFCPPGGAAFLLCIPQAGAASLLSDGVCDMNYRPVVRGWPARGGGHVPSSAKLQNVCQNVFFRKFSKFRYMNINLYFCPYFQVVPQLAEATTPPPSADLVYETKLCFVFRQLFVEYSVILEENRWWSDVCFIPFLPKSKSNNIFP